MWIRIHFGPWIRIQRYKIKENAEFKPQIWRVYFIGNYISKSEPKKLANFEGIGIDLKIYFSSLLLTDGLKSIRDIIDLIPDWIRIHKILWIRLQSIRIHITALVRYADKEMYVIMKTQVF